MGLDGGSAAVLGGVVVVATIGALPTVDRRDRGQRKAHGQESADRGYPLPIRLALGFDEAGEGMDLWNLYFVIRDAVRFVHKKAGTTHPKLP